MRRVPWSLRLLRWSAAFFAAVVGWVINPIAAVLGAGAVVAAGRQRVAPVVDRRPVDIMLASQRVTARHARNEPPSIAVQAEQWLRIMREPPRDRQARVLAELYYGPLPRRSVR